MIPCPVKSAPPEANAVICGEQRLTYRQLDSLAARWHGRLAGHARAWACADGSPELIALIHGAARAGTALALLSTRLAAPEREALIAALAGAPDALQLPDGPAPADPRLDPEAVHTLLFTSGTTGRPKAAQLTIGNHQANARASNELLGIEAQSRFVCCLPLFHVGGVAIAVRCALAGAAVLLHPRFDPKAVARDLREGATHASLVSATLARVLDEGGSFPGNIVLVGGGPVPNALLDKARRAGLRVLQTYGLTEASSQVSCERLEDADGATAGPPLPGVELKIEGGEILVRGPTVMRGYLHAPELQGFFRTGDLGELDARGRLIVHARRDDLILSGGENVYPAEVEAALLFHPAIAEAAVVPREDAQWGQVGAAFVVAREPPGDLAAFLRERLAAYKLPRSFEELPALPRLASGKVDRRALRERAAR